MKLWQSERLSACAALLLIGMLLGRSSTACELTCLQVQDEALAALKERFPNEVFTRGRDADVVRMGEVELGLQNLHVRLCLSGGDKARRHANITEFLEGTLTLSKDRTSKPPQTWTGAESMVRLQLMHSDYLKPFAGKKVLVTKSLVPNVEIAVVLDQSTGYAYVREEDRLKWRVSEKTLFEKALAKCRCSSDRRLDCKAVEALTHFSPPKKRTATMQSDCSCLGCGKRRPSTSAILSLPPYPTETS